MKRWMVVVLVATLLAFAMPTVIGIATGDMEAIQVEQEAEAHGDGSCSTATHSHWFGYNRLWHSYWYRVQYPSYWMYYHKHSWSYTPWYNHTVRTKCSLNWLTGELEIEEVGVIYEQ